MTDSLGGPTVQWKITHGSIADILQVQRDHQEKHPVQIGCNMRNPPNLDQGVQTDIRLGHSIFSSYCTSIHWQAQSEWPSHIYV
jgi:hypothetical protein